MGSNTSFVTGLLNSIAEHGRTLLERSNRSSGTTRLETLIDRCEALLSGQGEASGVALAADILDRYTRVKPAEGLAFFEALARDFGPDRARLDAAIQTYARTGSPLDAAEIHVASEPRRQELFRRFNLAPGGTRSLVHMREQLMQVLPLHAELAVVDRDFAHLFSSWFNRGFLVLRRIDWSTPANVLEKIIRYEAVHAIQDWNDLRARVDSPDRRCYAFFHPALIDEPLIFVEVALTKDTPGAIAPVLDQSRRHLKPQEAKTAVFYSISNCQKGLAGVSFGNLLIKQVVEEISRELPSLTTFVTLSPAPGFRKWLDGERASEHSVALSGADRKALEKLDTSDWTEKPEVRQELAAVLSPLAAYYFLTARTPKNKPLDPVARFHLGNGARLERINPMGDLSPKGIAQAAGLMVNYRYILSDIERNHEAFAGKGEVVSSPAVRKLVKADTSSRSLVSAS
ncbi:malonyl-CoA decarboxylase [Ancylobacter pratisalsi]|uniref:Malonyl-CoA decarboxylase n=1 Tax=Ancylobacter pratisalsi TaxID=1745854 RepID=A0A6P1YPX3_9HYPH|nr:malonyl-CoA decarboxylase [Ancylobacter pratisalsi]QIB35488.1 malonyl-CoA decarboxylase [Ancylobacter pratisalsi]